MIEEKESASPNGLKEEDMVKVVYKDQTEYKAIRGWILKEDDIFVTLKAEITNSIFRIGKAHIVIIRPSGFDREDPPQGHHSPTTRGEEGGGLA